MELCALYPNTVRSEKKRVSCFIMVVRVYRHIQESVISNAKLMTETTVQLPEVNAATVIQWLISLRPLYTCFAPSFMLPCFTTTDIGRIKALNSS